ncbi:MAG: cellulose synthase subunit BcsC [Candidatus Accumulibacter appositus]|uniref:Cellulose synthase subunit BcsC n=1 Tax=Candidatus Accumulibacter appositus TaxID=1454003 RepID=A0A011QLJ4_9PROT|nr:tetratricopeptide repeat protein [Accumulibacter sp.]EXI79749.1 MAG: cellulose synthase subunit BcsC [Candidatus Accumulibacter appositus]HRF05193.1 tetratricopeptide repeat protein [Accumulibacter sp.]
MSKRSAPKPGTRATPAAVSPGGAVRSPGRKRLLLLAGLAMLLVIAVLDVVTMPPAVPALPAVPVVASSDAAAPARSSAPAAATYVGASSCQSCHESEFKAWSGSHHQLAMQEATAATVLGDFADSRFTQQGVESTFFKSVDGKFMVRTDGPDGKLTDYPISYTFGVYPLQQYLIAFPGGRYQVLPIAWDARAKSEGGQRWFHLYPDQKVDHRDPLHWTGIYQNWALQCAECHSTNLRKGYNAASNSYQTTFSEINVACESCHGPASAHLEWAGKSKPPYTAEDDKGLPSLKSGWQEAWRFPGDSAKFAVRDQLADPAGMNSCGACHSRRGTLSEARKPGAPLEDSHRLAMLTAPNYHPDGQQREEVYVWGSFLQSKMHQNGVTCMDCHEPHSQQLRAEGNALCTRCHQASEFDVPKHHRHKAAGKGAECVTCHMPTQNYMVIHARPDHSLRIPRPDLSIALGSPNACTQCHGDKDAKWAAVAMDKWYGKAWRERPHYGTTLHAGETQGVRALPSLLELAGSPTAPAIVRATAATLAQPYVNPDTLPATRALLQDADPSVRIAALGMLAPVDPLNRVLSASPLLSDPVLGVRIEAARLLADVPDGQIPSARRAARDAALQEYVASLEQEADWPSANVNLGNLRLRQGRVDEAVAAFQRAIMLDRQFVGAYVNLADAWRQQGRDPVAEKVLREGLAELPRNADLHHALGLLLTRKGESVMALQEFAEAARLAPDNARYVYVQAIAVHSAGQRSEALALLRSANQRHPNDLEILSALISMSREAGDQKAALRYAKKAAEILPNDPNVKRLVSELEGR